MPRRGGCTKATLTIGGCGGHRFKIPKGEHLDSIGSSHTLLPVLEKNFFLAVSEHNLSLVQNYGRDKGLPERSEGKAQTVDIHLAAALLYQLGWDESLEEITDEARKLFKDQPNVSLNHFREAIKSSMPSGVLKLESESIGPTELQKFFADVQKETVPLQVCEALIADVKDKSKKGIDKSKKELTISEEELLLILTGWSIYNNFVFDLRRHTTTYQDMKKPLAAYFIASSHNSYLQGDQIRGQSSTFTIKRALLQGCRVVELDCYDGPDGSPIVYHGGTIVSKITFEECLEAINECAFVTSEYPVILTIENHVGKEQQQVMATMIKETFGPSLASPPPLEKIAYMSPEELKGKILLRDKIPKPKDWDKWASSANIDTEVKRGPRASTYEIDELESPRELPTRDRHKSLAMPGSPGLHNMSISDIKRASKVKFKKRHPAYSSLVHVSNWKFNDIIKGYVCKFSPGSASITEGSALEKLKTRSAAQKTRSMTAKHLLRTYPNNARQDSSNYDPMISWSLGAQLAALNYQTDDYPNFINMGKFRDNGHSGYVQKPELINHESEKDGEPIKLSIKPLFARQLASRQADRPQGLNSWKMGISMTVHGLKKDKSPIVEPAVKKTGLAGGSRGTYIFNKMNDESKTFEFEIYHPEMAILLIEVVESDMLGNFGEEVLQVALPVTQMMPGVRMLPLYDCHNFPTLASLVCHVQFDGSVPNPTLPKYNPIGKMANDDDKSMPLLLFDRALAGIDDQADSRNPYRNGCGLGSCTIS